MAKQRSINHLKSKRNKKRDIKKAEETRLEIGVPVEIRGSTSKTREEPAFVEWARRRKEGN